MIKLNTDTLRYIAALEKESGVQVKDCICSDEEIIYVVNEDKLGQAIGKKGAQVNKIRNALGKQIRIIGFNVDVKTFTKNLIGFAEPKTITLEENATEKNIIIEADHKTQSFIRGKKGKKLKILKDLLKRHHSVDDVIIKIE